MASKGPKNTKDASELAKAAQRPPAEILYQAELSQLLTQDKDPKPPGWRLSPKSVRTFILGDAKKNIRKKFVGHPSTVDRAMVTLATGRALILVGEPGTAKSLLSELLTAAICGDSTMTIQGSAATTEDHIRYGWNYALLLSEGPSERSLVPGPLYSAMSLGKICRFEELTRCPLEVQDSLLGPLSDRVLAIPEFANNEAMSSMLFAQTGFNIIATANTRDLGVSEMSAALKRRFNFETIFPIADEKVERELVKEESSRLLRDSGVPVGVPDDILELLVTTFRDLRSGTTAEGQTIERPSTAMSTAEAVNVAHAVGTRGHYFGTGLASPVDLVECILGTATKADPADVALLRRYFEQRVSKRPAPHWQAYYQARHRIPST